MLSVKDCLDYCDLTEDEIALFAQHEHLPEDVAATLVCGLVQTDAGVEIVDHCLVDMVSSAISCGAFDRAEHVLHVYAQFRSAHPLAH
jgi:uncharacterized membrane protein